MIRARISEAKAQFPELRVVVFSGGEAFLLKQELTKCVAHATALELNTRIVSNGSWAKKLEHARRMCAELRRSGLGELNLSTGRDHQEFVPEASIIHACEAAIECGVTTLVTVEVDTEESACYLSLRGNPRIQELLKHKKFRLITNVWMPFHQDASARRQDPNITGLRKGCSQVFDNLVITPHDNLSACCGLTLEHIPEMRLGKNSGTNMAEMYRTQASDFLKFWLRVDGPYAIIERVMGDAASGYLKGVVHGCQACAILHKTPEIKQKVAERHHAYVSEVMTRFAINDAIEKLQLPRLEGMCHET